MMAFPFLILATLLFLLTMPAFIGERSWARYGYAVFVSAFGVLLPLFVFVFSVFLVPEWKGGCKHGWIDCFHIGKLALSPIVLWATGALYAVEVCRIKRPVGRSVVLGLFLGTTVATACFLYGIMFPVQGLGATTLLWLTVPLYIVVWQGARLAQLLPGAQCGPVSLFIALGGSAPFWAGSMIWARRCYDSLPDKPPDCFVVTAASRGHESIVGPFHRIRRKGRDRVVNEQLVTFWSFESLWRDCSPRTHKTFRQCYNHFGPMIASRINSAWRADAVHLALKPAQWVAQSVVKLSSRENQ